jgi:predicted DNA-binding protein (UPF0251 family)
MPDLVTVEEARQHLGVSKTTIARLIKDNVLKTIANPLDHRVKLIKRQHIETLKNEYPVKPRRVG